jgi:hypothetical protein
VHGDIILYHGVLAIRVGIEVTPHILHLVLDLDPKSVQDFHQVSQRKKGSNWIESPGSTEIDVLTASYGILD